MVDYTLEILDYKDSPVAIVKLPFRYKSLSSAIIGGGVSETNTVFIMEVPMGYDGACPERDLEDVRKYFGLPEDSIGLMTAADIRRVITTESCIEGNVEAAAIVTAGTTNAVTAGERLPQSVIDTLPTHKAGTINIIVIFSEPLQDCGMVNATATIAEAKTAGMNDAGVSGTGTTSDALAILCPKGDGGKYASTASETGMAAAKAVRSAVAQSTRKWNKQSCKAKTAFEKLDELGIGEAQMWEAALGLYSPAPGWDLETVHSMFRRHIKNLEKDVNVNAMLYAAIRLEEQGNRMNLPGLEDIFQDDPVHLVADELLGIALAQYIAGTKGLFEYIRYDKNKPGILGILGPFLDDIVGSLIGSIMSNIYTELLEEKND